MKAGARELMPPEKPMPWYLLKKKKNSAVVKFTELKRTVEINEIHPDEKSKGYLFSLAIAKESATLARILADTKRQSEEWESFIVGKREGFGCALIGSCWCGEARGQPTTSRASYESDQGNIFGFLQLVLNWK